MGCVAMYVNIDGLCCMDHLSNPAMPHRQGGRMEEIREEWANHRVLGPEIFWVLQGIWLDVMMRSQDPAPKNLSAWLTGGFFRQIHVWDQKKSLNRGRTCVALGLFEMNGFLRRTTPPSWNPVSGPPVEDGTPKLVYLVNLDPSGLACWAKILRCCEKNPAWLWVWASSFRCLQKVLANSKGYRNPSSSGCLLQWLLFTSWYSTKSRWGTQVHPLARLKIDYIGVNGCVWCWPRLGTRKKVLS